ncbi:hypothetical protein J3R83DRAFT_5923 [Lanmaoa asiatica]|nr:hypothetical protein J3R83DRAFT_5923 [Lanmaoa asiatica]
MAPSQMFTVGRSSKFVRALVHLFHLRGAVSRRSSDGWRRCQPNYLQVVVRWQGLQAFESDLKRKRDRAEVTDQLEDMVGPKGRGREWMLEKI